MNIHEAIVCRVKELCKENNLSLNGLAIKAGLAGATVPHLVRGVKKNPSIRTLILIANAFDLSIAEFLNTDKILNSTLP